MELLERPGKAVGRVVAVFQRHIDDPGIAVGQLLGSQGEAAAADVLPQGHAAQGVENALEVVRGHIGLLRHVLHQNVLGEMLLDVAQGAVQATDPGGHGITPFNRVMIPWRGASCPDNLCGKASVTWLWTCCGCACSSPR